MVKGNRRHHWWHHRLIAALCCMLMVSQCTAAFAATQPTNLDLTSTTRTTQASGAGVINVGGTSHPVSASDILTPAENLALQQILSTGQQSIVLNNGGAAVGGNFRLSNLSALQISNLVIPQNVTAVQDFGINKALNLSGNLTNSGNLYAVSSSNAVTNALINATNIYNRPGALISSILPSDGLSGVTSSVSSLSLTLNALNDIINSGRITSSGNLTLTAGGSIINALPTGVTGPSPVMQAV